MARTKQTAEKSTYGRAPRLELMSKAVRKRPFNFPTSESEGQRGESFLKTDEFFRVSNLRPEISKKKVVPLSGRPDTIKIMKVRVVGDNLEDIFFRVSFGGYGWKEMGSVELNFFEARALYGTNIVNFAASRELIGGLDREIAYRLILKESLNDSVTHDECPESPDWVISEVVWKIPEGVSDCFQGQYFGIDEETPKEHLIDLYNLSFREVPPGHRFYKLHNRDSLQRRRWLSSEQGLPKEAQHPSGRDNDDRFVVTEAPESARQNLVPYVEGAVPNGS